MVSMLSSWPILPPSWSRRRRMELIPSPSDFVINWVILVYSISFYTAGWAVISASSVKRYKTHATLVTSYRARERKEGEVGVIISFLTLFDKTPQKNILTSPKGLVSVPDTRVSWCIMSFDPNTVKSLTPQTFCTKWWEFIILILVNCLGHP